MTNFNMNDIFVQVFEELFSYIGIDHKFMREVPSSSLNSTEEVNTLVGISGDMEGNIMFRYAVKTDKEIAGKLKGTSSIDNIDIFVKLALAAF